MKNNIYQHKQLQERQSASPSLTSSAPAKSDELSSSKLGVACRGEKTLDSGRTHVVKHTVFAVNYVEKTEEVLDIETVQIRDRRRRN